MTDPYGVKREETFRAGGVVAPVIETVTHPAHYGGKDSPHEVIKVMESWLTFEEFIGAMKFNIHKYLARAKLKGQEFENYRKAQFYQNYLTDYMKRRGLDGR